MAQFKMLDGNAAAVQAIKMAKVKVISAYPITPQSSIAEKLSELVDKGELKSHYIRVESEHTALSAAIGAQLTGVRTATATSSVGLALMHEILNVASGCRVPIVMPVVNRALVSPWSLWCDHQDSMSARDAGWLQLYCENVQDVFDLTTCAYRIAEDKRVQTPIMVCLDGFFLSHSLQKVLVPGQSEVDSFVGEYSTSNYYLNPEDPVVINNLTPSSEFGEMRYQQATGFEAAVGVIDEVFAEFEKKFGRKHARIEGYMLDDAEEVVVTLGSMSGTAKYVVNQLRAKGRKVGALKIVSFRPFPFNEVQSLIGHIPKVAVIDRSAGLGAQCPPLWTETTAALKDRGQRIKSYIAGLGGRDVSMMTIENVFDDLASGKESDRPIWIDVDQNAMKIREVEMYV